LVLTLDEVKDMSEPIQERWFKIDLHIHLPPEAAAGPAAEPLLAVLRQAAARSLDIIGLVDHNSVRGYEQLRLEMSRLAVLREAGQLTTAEEGALQEYQHLLSRLLLLPGFELTTQERAYLLALFPPETAAERLYALLLNLGIAMDRLREGAADTCARSDLPAACALISQAGGIAIAVHEDAPALSAAGPLPPGLLAVEVTALPEELAPGPRPYVWFSQANCRRRRPEERPTWDIGDRYTEVLLPTPSFESLRKVLSEGERSRLRFPETERARNYLEMLRQQFAGRLILYGEANLEAFVRDVAALANCGGGTLLVGLGEEGLVGVADPETCSAALARAVREMIEPPPRLNLELLRYGGQEVIRVDVCAEEPPPYLTREGVVYVRQEGQTRPASRAEVLELAASGNASTAATSASLDLPHAGVEIVGAYLREGTWFYEVRDLRVTTSVTRPRAKGLWAYAIERQEALRQGRADVSRILWKGDRGVWRAYRSGDRRVFDLVHRDAGGRIDHIFYGVSEWGLTPRWREIVDSLRPPLEEGAGFFPETEEGEGLEAAEGRLARATAGRTFRRTPTAEGPRERPAVGVPPETKATLQTEEVAPPATPAPAAAAPRTEVSTAAPARPSPESGGNRLPRWRGSAAVERVYWEGNNLFFDLAMRQEDGQVRYFRHVHRNQLAGAEGWVDLVRVPLPGSGVEVVRSTASNDEVLYQFRDMQTGRVDPRVRRKAEFTDDSPYAYAIRMYERDRPLDENRVRWWGNIGYLRIDPQRVDLVYRDEEGRDHIYYAAERALLEGEWKALLQAWQEEPSTAQPAEPVVERSSDR